jgi:hypothetical protein
MKTVPRGLTERQNCAPVWLRRDHLNNKLRRVHLDLEQLYKDLVVCAKVEMESLYIEHEWNVVKNMVVLMEFVVIEIEVVAANYRDIYVINQDFNLMV